VLLVPIRIVGNKDTAVAIPVRVQKACCCCWNRYGGFFLKSWLLHNVIFIRDLDFVWFDNLLLGEINLVLFTDVYICRFLLFKRNCGVSNWVMMS